MSKIRIFLADDHAVLRAGVRLLLESLPDMEIVGEATTGRETVSRVVELRPNLVIMDLTMPDGGGLEATAQLRRQCPEVQILVLTMHEDEEYFFRAIQAGATGYIAKGAAPDEFVSAVRSVAAGQAYIYPSLTKKLLEEYVQGSGDSTAQDQRAALTERETEVVRLIAEGKTSRQIAQLLQISAHTVDRHRQNIMAKLDLHNRAALIKYAIRHGLVDLEQ